MNVAEPVAPRLRAGAVTPAGFAGITGKIAAIVVGLLGVFVVAVTALIFQVNDLGRGDPRAAALDAAHHASSEALIAYQIQVASWHDIVEHDADSTTAAKDLQRFRDSGDAVSAHLTEVVEALPPGGYRDAARRFADEHRALRAVYDKALVALTASGGRNAGAAETILRGVDLTTPFDRFRENDERMEAELDALNAAHRDQVATRVVVIVVIAVLLLAGLIAAAIVVVRRVVRPIREVTEAAERIAGRDLPAAVAQIRAMEDGDEPPALAPLAVQSRDETASLAAAVHSLQTSAVALALEQRRSERNSAEMLVNLGRRNQNLLNRTLAYITELERTEQDPEVLDRLFRLDHATTRIRRNAESMLVLAGAHQTRTWSQPAPAADVIRAALSEIEDYNRVDIYHVQDVAVSGAAIADVVHLLAELIENATNFSPPSTQVTIVGQAVPEGYRIRVIDEGIGMTRSELEAANASIQRATEGRGASKLLGLYVVGRLAARRGIQVVLEPSGGRGVTASVVLPRELLSEVAVPRHRVEPIQAPVRRGSTEQQPEPLADWSGDAHRTDLRPVNPYSAYADTDREPETDPGPAPARSREQSSGSRSPGGLTRRVPGAQLPDLGPVADETPVLASLDAIDVRGRLSSLQAGVRAGRAADVVADHAPAPVPGAEPFAADPVGAEPAGAGRVTPQPAPAERAPGAVPVRVRGAQLPELGLLEDAPDSYLSPATVAHRWTLRSFQLDVDAARRAGAEPPPAPGAGLDEPGRSVGPDPEEA